MIEVQHVTKHYGPVTAVNDVSFRVDAGQILGFLGPNGAGKTTTMRILTGCIPATEGHAIVAGFDVFDQPVESKRRTGYLPETPPLYPDMTVREYLAFVARINGIKPGDRRECVRSAMARTSIEDVADRLCGKLSKDPAVPLSGPRVRRSHVAGGHQRVLRLPEPGNPDGALRDRAHRGPRRRGARG